jgi:hypothetical protein
MSLNQGPVSEGHGGRSRFDTRVGALYVILDLTRADLPNRDTLLALAQTWRSGDCPDEEFHQQVWSYLLENHSRVLHHEIHHFHQALAYPYLFLRSTRDTQVFGEVVRWFRDQGSIPLVLGPDGVPEIEVLGRDPSVDALRRSYLAPLARYGIRLEGNRVTSYEVDLNDRGTRYITEYLMLEDENKVFEFLLAAGRTANGDSFRRWVSRGPYLVCPTFDLLCDLGFSMDAAFWALPALVYYSYQTTIPMGIFAVLAQRLINEGLHSRVGSDDTGYLAAIMFTCDDELAGLPAATAPFNVLGLAENDPCVDLRPRIEEITRQSGSPLAWTVSRKLARGWPPPLDFCWPNRLLRDQLESWCHPPYSFVRLLHPDLGSGSVGFSIRAVAPETDSIRDVVLSLDLIRPLFELLFLGIFTGQPPHACGQTGCVARTRLCYDYSFFPWEATRCEFPKRFAGATRHEIDVPNFELRALREE